MRPTGIKLSREQWLIITFLFLLTLLNYLDRQILSLLYPVMRASIGLTSKTYALAIDAFLVAYAFMYAGSGLVLDRVGARAGLAFFATAWSVVSGLHGLVRGFWSLVVLRFLLGTFEPGGWTGSVKTISERFGPRERGLAAGIFSSGASLATAIAPPLIVYLTLRHGWRFAFVVPSTIGLAWLPAWLYVTRRGSDARRSPVAKGRVCLKDLWRSLGSKGALAYAGARFFGDSSGYFVLFWLPGYLTEAKHFSFAMLGALGWIPYLCNDLGPIVGGYASGQLVGRGAPVLFARKAIMTLGAIMVVGGAVVQTSDHTWVILAALSFATFGLGLWAGNLHALAADAFAPEIVASLYGAAGSVGAVGGILFNILVGALVAHGKYYGAFAAWALLEPLGAACLWAGLRDNGFQRDRLVNGIAQ